MKWKKNHPKRTINTLCEQNLPAHPGGEKYISFSERVGTELWRLHVKPGRTVVLYGKTYIGGEPEKNGDNWYWTGNPAHEFSISGRYGYSGRYGEI